MPPALDQKQAFPAVDNWKSEAGPSAETPQAPLKQNPDFYHKEGPLQEEYTRLTRISRVLAVVVILVTLFYRASIQFYVDKLWYSVRDEPWFYSAFFETIYTLAIYALVIALYPYLIHYIPYVQKFKVSSEVTYVHQPVLKIAKEAVIHVAPLLVLDLFTVKRYADVPYSEIAIRKQNWFVTTRALPRASPNFVVLCLHIAGSVFVFDLFFTAVHYALHRNLFLYKHFHVQHHTHDIVHPHVTNQLSVVERILQVLSANFALKVWGSHPLTRLVFVPVFLWFLVENHTGYDFPWGPHRLAPRGLMGGPVKHYLHHVQGHGNYQPFFTYLDNWLEKRKRGKQL